MKFYSNDGEIVEKPFRKFEAEHVLGRNHFYRVWLPVLEGVPLVEREGKERTVIVDGLFQTIKPKKLVPADGTFKVVKSAKSGRYLIVPAPPNVEPNTFLAFITDEAGFRGTCGLMEKDTTATVLCQDSTHASCSGNVTVVAIIKPGQKVVTFSNGRRNDDCIVYENTDGVMNRNVYTANEYKAIRDDLNGEFIEP